MKKTFSYFSMLLMFTLVSCGNPTENNAPEAPVATDSLSSDNHPEHSQGVLETDENEPNKKKALLTSLIGEHALDFIDGFVGANTMMEYHLDEGKWSASGSSNVGGTREGYAIDLTEEDIQKLTSSKIIVAEDLTVSYVCDGVSYFSIPFDGAGMPVELSQAPSEYYNVSMPDSLNAQTTFVNNILYLYAVDKVPSGDIEAADIAQVMADGFFLSCDEEGFQLALFYSGCCDNSIYSFKK